MIPTDAPAALNAPLNSLGWALFKAGFAIDPPDVYRIVRHMYDDDGNLRAASLIMTDAPTRKAPEDGS